MNELYVLRDGPGVSRLPNPRSGVYSVRGKVNPSDWDVADCSVFVQGAPLDGFGRLVRAWARPGTVANPCESIGGGAHAGWSYGIRDPEEGETAPCWEEVLSYFRLGANEADV